MIQNKDYNKRTDLKPEFYKGILIRYFKDSQTGVLTLIGQPVLDRTFGRTKEIASRKAKMIIDKRLDD